MSRLKGTWSALVELRYVIPCRPGSLPQHTASSYVNQSIHLILPHTYKENRTSRSKPCRRLTTLRERIGETSGPRHTDTPPEKQPSQKGCIDVNSSLWLLGSVKCPTADPSDPRHAHAVCTDQGVECFDLCVTVTENIIV